MLASQQPLPTYDPIQLVGTVRQIDNATYTVVCDGAAWQCRRAMSCLVAPQIGDEVLISGPDRQRTYLIAIIARDEAGPVNLSVQGDLSISSAYGSLTLQSATQTHIHSSGGVKLTSPRYEQKHDSADLVVGDMTYMGKAVDAVIGKTSLFSHILGILADRINSVARLSFRHVKEMDHVRADTIDYEAEKLNRIHGGFTTVTAREVVKIDGDQIHMS